MAGASTSPDKRIKTEEALMKDGETQGRGTRAKGAPNIKCYTFSDSKIYRSSITQWVLVVLDILLRNIVRRGQRPVGQWTGACVGTASTNRDESVPAEVKDFEFMATPLEA